MFGLITGRVLALAIEKCKLECSIDTERRLIATVQGLEKAFGNLQDQIENLRDEKANLEQRVDELEKSYATGSIQREQNEEPAVQVAPGFQRFSQRKRNFEREHAADGMTPTGRQILANQNQVDKVQTKPKEKR